MPTPDSHTALFRGVQTLLAEALDGPPGEMAFMLNPGDSGLLKQLEGVDAQTASSRPFPGRTTVAAHVDHVLYGFELFNRAAAGKPNPWQTADWTKSWERGVVDDAQWADLRNRFTDASKVLQRNVRDWKLWDDAAAAGLVSIVAHTMYHFGAIRQILSAQNKHSDKPV